MLMESFVELHENQLKFSNIPSHFWPTLCHKLENEILDVGKYFMMAQVVEEDEDDDGDDDDDVVWKIIVNVDEMKSSDPNNIFLIDHAWTYRPNEAHKQLKNDKKLLMRMAELMNVNDEDCDDEEELVERVFSEMWKFNQTYSIGNDDLGSESATPIWYVMDEFGSRVQHLDTPSVRMVPFCYVPTKTTFTIMWPLVDLNREDEVTRDYINTPNVLPKLRKYLLSPWIPLDLDEEEEDEDDGDADSDEIFNSKFSVHSSLPSFNHHHHHHLASIGRTIKVFTDVQQVSDHLKHAAFSLVDSWEEADIIWTKHYLSDFKSFSEETPNKFINQFPFEMVLTIKNMLPRVCKNTSKTEIGELSSDIWSSEISRMVNVDHEEFPSWLAVTFDLKNELIKFIRYYWSREDVGLSNYWILKPYNLSRGLDTHITRNINQIIRLVETGPKIASMYIDDPVLLRRDDIDGLVKFDLRFIIMLINVQPLKLAVHNKFLIRVANKPFSMDNFDDYEQHFTVMNYKAGTKMHIIACEQMQDMFYKQYPSFTWKSILSDIYGVIVEMFRRANRHPPPKGVGQSPQSRTIYGVDVMLKWHREANKPPSIHPVILECNFGPDNTRFLKSYPNFFNDIFETLFLNVTSNPDVTHLT